MEVEKIKGVVDRPDIRYALTRKAIKNSEYAHETDKSETLWQ